MAPSHRSVWPSLLDAASAPYRQAGRFAWRFARGKLRLDPVFRHLLSDGLIAPHTRVLDIGCGQGLLASLLCAASASERQGSWPSDWAEAPVGIRVTGIELRPLDIRRARTALAGRAEFICGDMRRTPFPESDAVVMLDVLHYVRLDEQDEVLTRARAALRPGGRLLLRVGDAAAGGGFALSRIVDRIVFMLRRQSMTIVGRTLAQWIARLQSLGFEVEPRPMSQGTPFANVLLVARLPAAPAFP